MTEDAASSTTVTMTFPKAGSAGEQLGELGVALVNKNLNFKSASGLSTLMILRNIEDDGGMPFTKAGRFGATVGFTCPPEKASFLAAILAADCSFEKWDVRDARNTAAVEVEEAQTSAQVVLTEHIFAASFGPQSPAGRPYYFSAPGSVPLADIKAFRSRAYGTNGAVLAATGVSDHAAFVKAVEEGLSAAPAGSTDAPAKATFLGGESRLQVAAGSYGHVALAFDGTAASSALLNVIKHVFQLSGASSGVSAFSTKGLVGVYGGSSSPGGISDSLCGAVTAKATPDLVKRAKGLAKAEALFALESGSKGLAEAMTDSVLETGTFTGPKGVAAAYDAITDKDIDQAISAMFKKTPALAAVGDITTVPYLGSIASRFS